MAFFNNLSFEPKRQFRFLVTFTGPGLASGLKYMVTKADKPSFENKMTEHSVLNHKFKFPGIVTWKEVNITFIDAVDPNVGSTFYASLLNAGYMKPLNEDAVASGLTKASSHRALGEVKIQQLDGGIQSGGALSADDLGGLVNRVAETNIVEEWTLKNAFLTKVDFGKLSYAEEGLVEIAIGVDYDYADLVVKGSPLQKSG